MDEHMKFDIICTKEEIEILDLRLKLLEEEHKNVIVRTKNEFYDEVVRDRKHGYDTLYINKFRKRADGEKVCHRKDIKIQGTWEVEFTILYADVRNVFKETVIGTWGDVNLYAENVVAKHGIGCYYKIFDIPKPKNIGVNGVEVID